MDGLKSNPLTKTDMKYKAIEKSAAYTAPYLATLHTRFPNCDLGICGANHVFTMDEDVWIEKIGDEMTALCPVLLENRLGNFFRAKRCNRRILGMSKEYAEKYYILTIL